jgi:septal ring factor EnvC (AmiA/AmiB activator)
MTEMNYLIRMAFAALCCITLSGCGSATDEQPPQNDNPELKAAQDRIEKSDQELKAALAKLADSEAQKLRLDHDFDRLAKEMGSLTKQVESLKQEISDLQAKLLVEIRAKKKALEDRLSLYKERFSSLPQAEQNRLTKFLDRLNDGEDIGLIGLRSLVSAGMINDDDPRYLKAKNTESSQ